MIKIVNTIPDFQSSACGCYKSPNNQKIGCKNQIFVGQVNLANTKRIYTVITKGSARCATYGSSCSSAIIVKSKEPRRRDLYYTKRISCWLTPPSRESTWHSPREVGLVLGSSRVVALKGEPRAPLFYGPDLPEGIIASCFLLALVRLTINCI